MERYPRGTLESKCLFGIPQEIKIEAVTDSEDVQLEAGAISASAYSFSRLQDNVICVLCGSINTPIEDMGDG